MRPHISVVSDELIAQILTEAKRILAEIGVEVRGQSLRQRLLNHGLRQAPDSGRILFPPDVLDKAICRYPARV